MAPPSVSTSSSSAFTNAVERFQTNTYLEEELAGNLYSFHGGLRPIRSRIEALSSISVQLKDDLDVLLLARREALHVEASKFLSLVDDLDLLQMCVHNCRRSFSRWCQSEVEYPFRTIQYLRRRYRIHEVLQFAEALETSGVPECVSYDREKFTAGMRVFLSNNFCELNAWQDMRAQLEERLLEFRSCALAEIMRYCFGKTTISAIHEIWGQESFLQTEIASYFSPRLVSDALFEFIVQWEDGVSSLKDILVRLKTSQDEFPAMAAVISQISRSCVDLYVLMVLNAVKASSQFPQLVAEYRMYMDALCSIRFQCSAATETILTSCLPSNSILSDVLRHVVAYHSRPAFTQWMQSVRNRDDFETANLILFESLPSDISSSSVMEAIWAFVGECLVTPNSLSPADIAEVLSDLAKRIPALRLGPVYELLQLVGADLTLIFEWSLAHLGQVPLPLLQALLAVSETEDVREIQTAITQLELLSS